MPPVYSLNAQSNFMSMLESDVKRVFLETVTNTPIFYALDTLGVDDMFFSRGDSPLIYNLKKSGHASAINTAGAWVRGKYLNIPF